MESSYLSFLPARVRAMRPLVHHITNYVTVNDCANITLAAGAAPVMTDAPEEVAEMVGMADALVLNIGTLSSAQVEAMLIAGQAANARGIPIVLDPVGAGATRFRTATAIRLLDGLRIDVLKGNAGEIGTIAGVDARTRGVDSDGFAGDPAEVVRTLARECGCVVGMSGAVDVVSDGDRVAFVESGHPLMGCVSGTGCMASSVTGAFAAVGDDRFASTVAALAAFGLAGERAAERATGPGSFRPGLLDALAGLEPAAIEVQARIRMA